MNGLDAWITGNYGEDHPDNVDDRSDQERHEATCRAIDAERHLRARADAWRWITAHCNGIDNIGDCPICGERVQVLGSKVTEEGRVIASCGDALWPKQWEEDPPCIRCGAPESVCECEG